MKLISWNVNGLRALLRKGLLGYLAASRPDVMCLQEVRA
jgi:exodeoxyribonuclease-3